jgi:peptidoglycan/LPS O-acetylase OafA/YrhL
MKKNISEGLSLYLELMRFIAALAVFLYHSRLVLVPNMPLGPFGWGREAVAVFFVLSGFVISYVVSSRERDWRDYVVARIARIAPVCLIAILVTVLADGFGKSYNFELYERLGFDQFSIPALMSYLTFTNQFWFSHQVFGSDEAYWSLGFEVQYYILFAVICFVDGRLKWLLAIAWAAICGPKILMYLPLWLMGVAAQRIVFSGMAMKARTGLILFGGSLLLFFGAKLLLGHHVTGMYKTSGSITQEVKNFCYFSLIGLAVAANIISASVVFQAARFRSSVASAVRWVAGGSFTLYLVHEPLVLCFSAYISQFTDRQTLGLAAMLIVLAICYGIAEIIERRKKTVASWIREIAGLHAPRLTKS